MYTTMLPLVAILVSAAILLTGNGLQGVLIPVRGGVEQFATSVIGLLSTAYSAGFIVSCFLTPLVVQRVGHIRTFAALAALAAAVILTMSLAVQPLLWIGLRLISGFCLAGLFMVIESWLNEKASNDNRGQVFSLYMIINLSAVTFGQMLLPSGDPATSTLFIVTGVAIVLALIPVSLTKATAPAPIKAVKLRLRRLYQMSPVGIIGCFFVGLGNGAYAGLGALFAQQLGFSVLDVALFMSASLIGGALFQLPIGRLSDRIDRRWVIIGVCIGAGTVGVALALAGGFSVAQPAAAVSGHWLLIGLSAALGCFIYVQYALCVAHTNDFISAEDFVEASSGLLLTYGIGATIGPMIAATAMTAFGPGALFVFTAGVSGVFLLFTLYRMSRRAAVPIEERDRFVSEGVSTRFTPVAAEIDPRASMADSET